MILHTKNDHESSQTQVVGKCVIPIFKFKKSSLKNLFVGQDTINNTIGNHVCRIKKCKRKKLNGRCSFAYRNGIKTK